METKQVTIRLPACLIAEIERTAKEEKRNRSNMISYILREWVEKREKEAKEGGNGQKD
jgi:metal-responsive CopG/Arc/MetJ family transcriptional regulator